MGKIKMRKFLYILIIGFISLLSYSYAADSNTFIYEADVLASKIKKGKVLSKEDVNLAVDNSTGEVRIFPYRENQLQELISDLMKSDTIDDKYKDDFQAFIKLLKPKYEELRGEGCTEPVYAILSNIVLQLMPEDEEATE